jgi:hypothetical protein
MCCDGNAVYCNGIDARVLSSAHEENGNSIHRQCMKFRGSFYTTAVLSYVKEHFYRLGRSLGRRTGELDEETNHCPCRKSNLAIRLITEIVINVTCEV